MNRLDLPMSTTGRTAEEVAILATRLAAGSMLSGLTKARQFKPKGIRDFATDTDIAAEEAIMNLLRREFPDHSVLAEESGMTGKHSDYLWIIDPLDGTTNYSQGIPSFCVSVALAYREQVILGAVRDPLRKELFLAVKGGGATLNGKPVFVSTKTDLSSAVVGFDLGYDEVARRLSLESAGVLLPTARTLRLIGSAALALAYTAAGRLDAFYQHRLYSWDWAAGSLLVSEAGGEFTNLEGTSTDLETGGIIAANHFLHSKLLGIVGSTAEAYR